MQTLRPTSQRRRTKIWSAVQRANGVLGKDPFDFGYQVVQPVEKRMPPREPRKNKTISASDSTERRARLNLHGIDHANGHSAALLRPMVISKTFPIWRSYTQWLRVHFLHGIGRINFRSPRKTFGSLSEKALRLRDVKPAQLHEFL